MKKVYSKDIQFPFKANFLFASSRSESFAKQAMLYLHNRLNQRTSHLNNTQFVILLKSVSVVSVTHCCYYLSLSLEDLHKNFHQVGAYYSKIGWFHSLMMLQGNWMVLLITCTVGSKNPNSNVCTTNFQSQQTLETGINYNKIWWLQFPHDWKKAYSWV